MVNSGLDQFILSLDGASQETFSKYRREGNFDTVIKNLRQLVHEKKAAGKDKPYIELQFITMSHNEHEIPKMKALAKEIGVDKLKIKTVNLEMEVTGEKEKMKKYLPKDEEHSRYKIDTLVKKDVAQNKCERLWLSSVINWDGSVVSCCYDPNRKYEFGNCFEEGSFKAVWNNNKYQNFRKAILKNKQSISMCKECFGKLVEA